MIEVMIVVAIVAILAAVAYPSYRDYIVRGRLVDATNGLTFMRAEMERYFQDNRRYTTYTVGATTYTAPCAAGTAATRTYGNFLVSCSAVAANTFTLQAVSTTAPTNGFTFTVNQLDVRSTTAPTGWNSGACWLIRKGQTC